MKGKTVFLVFLALGLLLAAPMVKAKNNPNLIWRFEKIVLHGMGIAITQDGSEFHVLRAHVRDLRVAPDTLCSTDDVQCLENQGKRTAIGAIKIGKTIYRAKGDVEYTAEGKVSSISLELYPIEVPYRCLISVNETTLCEEEPAESVGHVKVDVYHNYEGVPNLAVGNLEVEGKEYLVFVKGVGKVQQLRKKVRVLKAVKTGSPPNTPGE